MWSPRRSTSWWLKNERRTPTVSSLFEIASFGPGNSAQIARNGFDLALGGIRLSQIEVPTAKNVGENTGVGACPRWGYHQPFDLATLRSLYRSHGDYVEDVVRVTRNNLKRGFITKADAVVTVVEALANRVGDQGRRARFDWWEHDRDFRHDHDD